MSQACTLPRAWHKGRIMSSAVMGQSTTGSRQQVSCWTVLWRQPGGAPGWGSPSVRLLASGALQVLTYEAPSSSLGAPPPLV